MTRAWTKPSWVWVALFALLISQIVVDRIHSRDLTRAYRWMYDLQKENDAAYRRMAVLNKENKALHERIARLERAAHQFNQHGRSHSATQSKPNLSAR